MVCGLFSP